jgi:hypothetical protein
MTVKGFPMHVASAIMPGFITCASNLVEACNQGAFAGTRRPENARGANHRIDDVARPGRGVLDRAREARPYRCLVQLHLCLGKSSFAFCTGKGR